MAHRQAGDESWEDVKIEIWVGCVTWRWTRVARIVVVCVSVCCAAAACGDVDDRCTLYV